MITGDSNPNILSPWIAVYPLQLWQKEESGSLTATTLINGYQKQCLGVETDAPPGAQEVSEPLLKGMSDSKY